MILKALVLAAAVAAAPAPQAWTPCSCLIARLEQGLALPTGARALSDYTRSYAGTTLNGRRIVEGVLESERQPDPQPRIVPHDKLPLVLDGGCSIITLRYDVAEKRLIDIACNGES